MRVHRENPRYAQDKNYQSKEAVLGSEDLPTIQQDGDEVQNSKPPPPEPTPEQLLKELQDELKRAQAERNVLAKQATARQRSQLVKQQILQARQ